MEELIKDLKNRYDGANASMKPLDHKSYKKGRQEGKAAAYEHCIRQLEKSKKNVDLDGVSNFVLLAKSNYKAKDGTIKRGVEIKGKYYAPKNDC